VTTILTITVIATPSASARTTSAIFAAQSGIAADQAPPNPWGYNFDCCSLITSHFFPCIASFWSGTGYVVECADTMYSKSGGLTASAIPLSPAP